MQVERRKKMRFSKIVNDSAALIDKQVGPQCYAPRAPNNRLLRPRSLTSPHFRTQISSDKSRNLCLAVDVYELVISLVPIQEMSTPNPRDRRSLRNSAAGTSTPSGEPTLTGVSALIY